VILAAIIAAIGAILGPLIPALLASSSESPGSQPPPSGSSKHPVLIEDTKLGFGVWASIVYPRKIVFSQVQLDSLRFPGSSVGRGYAIGDMEMIGLVVAGDSATPVTIDGMAVVKSCSAPLVKGATLFYAINGAGIDDVTAIHFNLDQPNPIANRVARDGHVTPYFFHYVVTLRYHEQHAFGIEVTSSSFCRYYLKLSVATSHGPVSERISYRGQPFLITGLLHRRNDPYHGVAFKRYAAAYVYVVRSNASYHYVRITPQYHCPQEFCA
jgi:hypothetical protein